MTKKEPYVTYSTQVYKGVSDKEALDHYYDFFVGSIEILRKIEEIVPSVTKEYVSSKNEFFKEQIENMDDEGKKQYQKYLRLFNTKVNRRKKSITITHKRLAELLEERDESFILTGRIPMFTREMSLVHLVVLFEEFLSSTLSLVMNRRPGGLIFSKKTIIYEDVFKHADLRGLLSSVIDDEIKSLINNDPEELNDELKKRYPNLNMSQEKDWRKFKERFYRRHIIIHNRSIPDRKYIKKTGYRGEVSRISTDGQYLDQSFKIFERYSRLIHDFFMAKFFTRKS